MAEQAVVLNIEWLNAFIKEHVAEFRTALESIGKDSPDGVRAMDNLTDIGDTTIYSKDRLPLVIGLMASDDSVSGGAALNTKLKTIAEQIAELLIDQGVLFEDLEEAMRATIKELEETQSTNLEQITAEDFLDIFEDVDPAAAGAGSGGNDDD